jgi:hypothetical protein
MNEIDSTVDDVGVVRERTSLRSETELSTTSGKLTACRDRGRPYMDHTSRPRTLRRKKR